MTEHGDNGEIPGLSDEARKLKVAVDLGDFEYIIVSFIELQAALLQICNAVARVPLTAEANAHLQAALKHTNNAADRTRKLSSSVVDKLGGTSSDA